MSAFALKHDPYNLIIAGVGGQGNVMTSRTIGNMLSELGLFVTIGDTFGASQRGGSVMSHLRISVTACYSPQIPKGGAHMVVSMEPSETIRVLRDYGNPAVQVITNTRPLYPIAVIAGRASYPNSAKMEKWIGEISAKTWYLNATAEAMKIGPPALGNVIMAGALAGTGELPLQRDVFASIIATRYPPEQARQNLAAYDFGARYVAAAAI